MCSSLAVKKETVKPKAPKANVFAPVKFVINSGLYLIWYDRNTSDTLFKKYYDRGDLPIVVNSSGAHRKVEILRFEQEINSTD